MKKYLALCLLALPLAAELPPLSPEDRLQQSSRVVVAKIGPVHQLRVDGEKDQTKILFSATAQVQSVVKGSGLKSGDTIECTYWKAGARPRGWVGPGGQYQPLVPNTTVRLYLEADNQLLNPNGWEKI